MKRFSIVVFLPLAALLCWLFSLQYSRMIGVPIRVPIEGYDPRDLLSGHYLRFRFSLDGISPCSETNAERSCLCYGQEAGTNSFIPFWAGRCDQRPKLCPLYISGTCRYGQLSTGKERYSIPERLAPALMTVPEKATVQLFLDGSGGFVIGDMFVGDEPIESYAERKLGTKLP